MWKHFRIVLMIAVALAFVLAWAWVPAGHRRSDCQLVNNAAWISVDWFSKRVQAKQIAALAKSVADRKLAYVFPYASYLRKDHSFNPSFKYALDFAQAYRRFDLGTKLIPWFGIPTTNSRIDLDDPTMRRKIVAFTTELVKQARLDGVHLDVEPVADGNQGFLRLLEETRQALPKDKTLSLSGIHWLPAPLIYLPVVRNHRWSSAYYRQVAQHVDQIAVMSYDSGSIVPAQYRWFLREQIRGISRSLKGTNTELLFGVSVSREATPSHRPSIENLSDGIAGICQGIPLAQRLGKPISGISIYADWDFGPSDARVWQEWLGASGNP